MKTMICLARRQLVKGQAASLFLVLSLFFCTMLLHLSFVGISSLENSVQFHKLNELVPMIQAAGFMFSILILIMGVLLIQNGFLISLEQRTRLFAQMYTLGCSNRHLQQCLLAEIAILFVISVPAALLSSHIGISVLFSFLNASPAITSRVGVLRIHYSAPTLALLIVCIVLTLVLSAIRPLITISKFSPLAALRQPHTPSVSKHIPEWSAKKPCAPQLAHRNLQRYALRYHVISIGIACCLIIIYITGAVAHGVAVSYEQQAKPFDYRIVVYAADGVEPTDILQKCKTAESTNAVQISELMTSVPHGDGFRPLSIIALEDAVFDEWYGKPLNALDGAIACVEATAVSNLPFEGDLNYDGFTFRKVDSCDHPTPLGIGKMLDTFRDTTVLFTSKSMLDSSYQMAKERMYAVYYPTDDGTELTETLSALMENTSLRYEIQDFTPTSQWQLQKNAFTLLISTLANTFPFFILIVFMIEMLATIFSGMVLRKKELALLQCLGFSYRNVEKLLLCESFYYIRNGLLVGIPLGLIFSALITARLRLPVWSVLNWQTILLPIIILMISQGICMKLVKHILGQISLTQQMNDV